MQLMGDAALYADVKHSYVGSPVLHTTVVVLNAIAHRYTWGLVD